MRNTLLLSAILIVCSFSCKQSTDTKDDVEEGIRFFSTHGADVEVVPNVIHKDSLITLTMTCYPAMTGVGVSWISLGGASFAPIVLEYPWHDTLLTNTNVLVRASFVASVPYSQQWKFKQLEYVPGGGYGIEARASFDSIYVADSLKMYWVHSEELVKILGGAVGVNEASGCAYVTTVPTNP